MASLLHAIRERTLASSIAGWIGAGLERVAARHKGVETRIVNSTGSTVVLRSKFRDVWEEARFRLGQGESVVVRWAPDKPYDRLGVFVETSCSKGQSLLLQPSLPLLIGQSAIALNQEIVLSRSESCKNRYHMVMMGRELP